jgi:hypothetical protein
MIAPEDPMEQQLVETSRGPVALWAGAGPVLGTAGDFLDLLMSSGSATVAVPAAALAPAFFDLKTGLAGECLQKVSNYRRHLAILGDFSEVGSKSLRDFIGESNKTGQVVFAATLEEATELWRG